MRASLATFDSSHMSWCDGSCLIKTTTPYSCARCGVWQRGPRPVSAAGGASRGAAAAAVSVVDGQRAARCVAERQPEHRHSCSSVICLLAPVNSCFEGAVASMLRAVPPSSLLQGGDARGAAGGGASSGRVCPGGAAVRACWCVGTAYAGFACRVEVEGQAQHDSKHFPSLLQVVLLQKHLARALHSSQMTMVSWLKLTFEVLAESSLCAVQCAVPVHALALQSLCGVLRCGSPARCLAAAGAAAVRHCRARRARALHVCVSRPSQVGAANSACVLRSCYKCHAVQLCGGHRQFQTPSWRSS